MKEGHVVSLTAKLFSLAMSRIYTITDKKGNSILIPIPASTRDRHMQRFSYFCHLLSERTGIRNGYNAIQIESDRAELKGVRNVDKIFNLKFNPSLFSDKQVILIDDVLNSGTGFIQIKRKLIDLGAK